MPRLRPVAFEVSIMRLICHFVQADDANSDADADADDDADADAAAELPEQTLKAATC